MFKRLLSFQSFKYAIYLLLAINVFLFFIEDFTSSLHTLNADSTLQDWLTTFSGGIDTLAWFVLLLVFELETYVLDDDKIVGRVKWTLDIVRVFCYCSIVYAFYGYGYKLYVLFQVEPALNLTACQLVEKSYSFMTTMDEYAQLTLSNCTQFVQQPFVNFQLMDAVVTDKQTLMEARKLGFVDVLNSGAWLAICVLLEIDVWLQHRGGMKKQMHTLLKGCVYGVLLGCAIYWGIYGDFLDFWDAVLWIFAFLFIELNLFEWSNEKTALESV